MVPSDQRASPKKNVLFWSFSFVCPEPVLVKRSFIYKLRKKVAFYVRPVRVEEFEEAAVCEACHRLPAVVHSRDCVLPVTEVRECLQKRKEKKRKREKRTTFVCFKSSNFYSEARNDCLPRQARDNHMEISQSEDKKEKCPSLCSSLARTCTM